jgi:hypothetical protein
MSGVEVSTTRDPPEGEIPMSTKLRHVKSLIFVNNTEDSRPVIMWPFNRSTTNDPLTTVESSPFVLGLGISIQTPPTANSIVRAPIDGKIKVIMYENKDKKATIVIHPDDFRLIVVLENISSVNLRSPTLQEQKNGSFPYYSGTVTAGDPIGELGMDNPLTLRVAYWPRGPKISASGWQWEDPRNFLPQRRNP